MAKPDWIRRNERLAERYGGYLYPWRSKLEPGNGEDAYTALVRDHLRPEIDVVEAGCGHGSDALMFAPQVRSYLGYDAVGPFIATARRRAAEAGLGRLAFVVADSSPKRAGRVPADDQAVDLIISRRGPSNFILDARRVCRPGAVLLQVCYLATPVPEWNEALPPSLRMQVEPDTAGETVHEYLGRAGLKLHSSQVYDVEERFEDPLELLQRLTWGRDSAVSESEHAAVSLLFGRVAGEGQLSVRHRRLLWKAVIPG